MQRASFLQRRTELLRDVAHPKREEANEVCTGPARGDRIWAQGIRKPAKVCW